MWLTGRVREQLDAQRGFGKDIEKDAARIFEVANKQQHDAQRAFVKDDGDPSQRQEAFCALFCGHTKAGKPKIFEIDVQGARGFHTAPYAAIGSGGIFAVHAIVSVSHFNVLALTLEQASALAYRTIANAIKTAAYGLGGKVQMCSVTPDKAWCLPDGELKAVADVVDIWNAKEVETLGTLGKAQPTPPSAPSDEPPTEG